MARFLLLHAFPFDASMWDAVAVGLRSQGHDVLAPDLRGFGSAPLGDCEPRMGVLVDDVISLLGERPAVVVGCSMGGYVALGIAERRPDLVAALALVDTKATADSEQQREHRLRVASLAESGEEWSAGMIDGLLGASTRAARPEIVDRVQGVLDRAPRATVAWAQRAMAGRADTRTAIATLTSPIAVLMGEEDTMSPRDEQDLIREAAPHATWMPIPEAGHLTPLESPGAVTAALLRLVASDDA